MSINTTSLVMVSMALALLASSFYADLPTQYTALVKDGGAFFSGLAMLFLHPPSNVGTPPAPAKGPGEPS